MKLEPVTKLDKRHGNVKKIEDDVISADCDVTVFFQFSTREVGVRTYGLQNLHFH